jgi:hypothetical protein
VTAPSPEAMAVARNLFRPTNRDAVEQVAALYEALRKLFYATLEDQSLTGVAIPVAARALVAAEGKSA